MLSADWLVSPDSWDELCTLIDELATAELDVTTDDTIDWLDWSLTLLVNSSLAIADEFSVADVDAVLATEVAATVKFDALSTVGTVWLVVAVADVTVCSAGVTSAETFTGIKPPIPTAAAKIPATTQRLPSLYILKCFCVGSNALKDLKFISQTSSLFS